MIEITTGVLFFLSSMYGVSTSTINSEEISTIDNEAVVTVTMDKKTNEEVREYINEYFKDTPELIAVAECESTLMHYDKKGNIVRGRVDRDDVGIMQINERYHLERALSMGLDLHTIEGNLAYAKKLYEKEGLRPWNPSAKCWQKKISSTDVVDKLAKR